MCCFPSVNRLPFPCDPCLSPGDQREHTHASAIWRQPPCFVLARSQPPASLPSLSGLSFCSSTLTNPICLLCDFWSLVHLLSGEGSCQQRLKVVKWPKIPRTKKKKKSQPPCWSAQKAVPRKLVLGADFLPHSTGTAERRHPKMVWKLCSWIGILLKLAAEPGWGGVRLFKSGSMLWVTSLSRLAFHPLPGAVPGAGSCLEWGSCLPAAPEKQEQKGGGGGTVTGCARQGTLQPSFMMEHLRTGRRLPTVPGAPCCLQVGVPNLSSIYRAGRSREGST